VEGTLGGTRLTRREREIARLIGLGHTNKQIGVELAIKERTVGAHVQNILNKLAVNNRAQIAAWSALDSAPKPARPIAVADGSRPAVRSHPVLSWLGGLLTGLAIVIAATDDGARPTLASEPPRPLPGSLVYEAQLLPGGEGFGTRYVIGDPKASDVRYVKGAVEFLVIKPGGNTGNNLAMASMRRYFADGQLSVEPGSNVEFWINLGSNGYATHIGDHVIDFQTATELMQVQYMNFVDNKGALPLGPQVHVQGLQAGKPFEVSVMVDPPHYHVFLDGRKVISLEHGPSADFQQISFSIFGEGGLVRLTSMRVYRLTS